MMKLYSKHLTDQKVYAHKKLKVLFSLLCLFTSTALFAQQTVRGRVTTLDGPLANATVQVRGTTNVTQTNANGEYSINVKPDDVLVFTSVGFNAQEIPVNSQTTIDVKMSSSSQMMSDVVVVGYGTQRRSDVTGSVSSVPKNRLTELPVTNVLQAMEGSVAGVSITNTSSVPGRTPDVLIRGQNSLGANSGPYIVVDGVPFTKTGAGINDINPNDIASIEILKDASATAIYGVNGANGVILITTKRGNTGKPTIRYNGYSGFDKSCPLVRSIEPRGVCSKICRL